MERVEQFARWTSSTAAFGNACIVGTQPCGLQYQRPRLPAHCDHGVQDAMGLRQIHRYTQTARRDRSSHRRLNEMKGSAMEISPLRSEADYKAMLAEVSALIELDPDGESPEGERLEVLGLLVAVYEAKHYPISAQSPIEAATRR